MQKQEVREAVELPLTHGELYQQVCLISLLFCPKVDLITTTLVLSGLGSGNTEMFLGSPVVIPYLLSQLNASTLFYLNGFGCV